MQITPQDWQSIESHYSRLQTLSIELQDRYQVNVNLLLLAYELDQRQLSLPLTCWQQLQSQTCEVETQLLSPYRQLRRCNKTYLNQDEYQQMLTLELLFERKLQRHISTWLADYQAQAGANNLSSYLSLFNLNVHQFPLLI